MAIYSEENITVKTETEILADLNRIAQELGLINQVFESSRINVYYAVFARVFGNLTTSIAQYIANINIDTCTDEALLEQLISPFVEKNRAKVAKTILTFKRRDIADDEAEDIFIPRNFEVSTEGGNPIVFRTAESRILWKDSYFVKVPAYSVDLGVTNNVSANTLTYFNDVEFHNVEVTNEYAAYGGTNEETAFDARQRIALFRYNRDGSITQLTSMLGELGFYVSQFNIQEYYDGFGSVLIALEVKNDDEYRDVINRIEFGKVAGVKYHYCKVVPLYMNFNVTFKVVGSRIYDEYTVEEMNESVKSAIELYFTQNVFVGQKVSLKRLEAYALNYIANGNYEVYEIHLEITNDKFFKKDPDTGEIVVAPYEKIYPNKLEISTDYLTV